MQLGSTFILLILWMTASFTTTVAQVKVEPFEMPGRYDQAIAKKHQLKVALRFGYLRENKEAESLRRRTEYNAAGYPLTIYDFNTSGGIEQKATYTYDASGTKVREASLEQYNANLDLERSLFYRFDAQDQLILYRSVNKKGQEYSVGYTYDPDGRLLTAQQFEIDGFPGAKDVYAYDAKGQLTELVKYAVGNREVERRKYDYNGKGQQTTEQRFRNGDRLLYTLHAKYDDLDRKVRELRVLSSGQEYGWEEWKYDFQGKLTEHRTQDPAEDKPMREIFRYDRRGRQ
ncbi:MAG: hypothetical protein AAF570_28210, partial [Bacteroidota bacterium]